MRVGWSIVLVSAVLLLAWTLARLSAAGRLYRGGRIEEAGRRARATGLLSLSLGPAVLAAGLPLAAAGPAHPWLGRAGLCFLALAAIAGGLGGLSRKPLPSAHVAWALFAVGSAAVAAAVLL